MKHLLHSFVCTLIEHSYAKDLLCCCHSQLSYMTSCNCASPDSLRNLFCPHLQPFLAHRKLSSDILKIPLSFFILAALRVITECSGFIPPLGSAGSLSGIAASCIGA